jgi:hypothetical protein
LALYDLSGTTKLYKIQNGGVYCESQPLFSISLIFIETSTRFIFQAFDHHHQLYKLQRMSLIATELLVATDPLLQVMLGFYPVAVVLQ